MGLTVEEVRRIAHLARLRLSAEEEVAYVRQLDEIVRYIDQLQGYETRPESGAVSPPLEAEDRPVAGEVGLADFLANAPDTLDTFLLVPQVKVTRDE